MTWFPTSEQKSTALAFSGALCLTTWTAETPNTFVLGQHAHPAGCYPILILTINPDGNPQADSLHVAPTARQLLAALNLRLHTHEHSLKDQDHIPTP